MPTIICYLKFLWNFRIVKKNAEGQLTGKPRENESTKKWVKITIKTMVHLRFCVAELLMVFYYITHSVPHKNEIRQPHLTSMKIHFIAIINQLIHWNLWRRKNIQPKQGNINTNTCLHFHNVSNFTAIFIFLFTILFYFQNIHMEINLHANHILINIRVACVLATNDSIFVNACSKKIEQKTAATEHINDGNFPYKFLINCLKSWK